jgi:HEAT repeat protein
MRYEAAAALAKVAWGCRDAAEALLAVFDEGEEGISRRASRAFCRVTVGHPELAPWALATVLERLGSDDPRVRSAAVVSTVLFGSDAREAVPGLLAILRTADEDLELLVLGALANIGGASEPVLPFLIERMRSESVDRRLETVQVLRLVIRDEEFPPDSEHMPRAIEALRRVCADSDDDVRQYAIWTARDLGPRASSLVDEIVRLTQDANSVLRAQAVETLAKLGVSSEDVREAIERTRKDSDLFVREAAEKTLRELYPTDG